LSRGTGSPGSPDAGGSAGPVAVGVGAASELGISGRAAGGTGGHLFPAEALARELMGRGHKVALVTDGRMSGASGKVPAAIHVTPEAAAGRKIYTQGTAAENVPACVLCHGQTGGGNGTIPRLAGQHSAYIERQLEAFASNARANEIMHANSKGLTPEQIRDVATYVRSL